MALQVLAVCPGLIARLRGREIGLSKALRQRCALLRFQMSVITLFRRERMNRMVLARACKPRVNATRHAPVFATRRQEY